MNYRKVQEEARCYVGPKPVPESEHPDANDPTPDEIEERAACIRPKHEKATPRNQPKVYEPRIYSIDPELINQMEDPREC